jgi:hypothetical protein
MISTHTKDILVKKLALTRQILGKEFPQSPKSLQKSLQLVPVDVTNI